MTDDVVIRVENLSKRYRIGSREEMHDTFIGAALSSIRKPIQNLRNLRQLTQFDLEREDDDIIWALKDVSFEVKRGEILGIIGRNGAGKSTLLKILSRITHPTKGRVEIKGRVSSLLEVGTGFHRELSGRENIYLNGSILGMTKKEIDRKFDEIVDFSGVEKFIDTPVKHYSSGMYVRLAFAVAAHLEPEILLVDEVLAVGDAEFQKKCLGKMSEVAEGGRTVLFVSHNLGAVSGLCKKSMLVSNGKVGGFGYSHKIIKTYVSKNQLSGSVDLSNWNLDRIGDGPYRILYLETKNKKKQIQSQFSYGERIIFSIGISAEIEQICIIGLSIRNSKGYLIHHFSNLDDSTEIRLPSDTVEVEMCLDRVILNDDLYVISIWLGDRFNTLHDRVGNCLSFTIRSPSEGQIISLSPVRLPAQWGVTDKKS